MRAKSLLTAAAAVLFAVLATPSYSGYISGDVELSGTFSKLPDAGGSSIVSGLSFINVAHSATIDLGTATGWFASLPPDTVAVANNINLDPSQPIHFTYTVGEFTFLATGVSNIVRSTPLCTDTSCTDELTFNITGVVSAPGFSTTTFNGTWTGIGSCSTTGRFNNCSSDVTGHWTVALDPPVNVAAVPEPGSVVLIGLALGILGLVSRRYKA